MKKKTSMPARLSLTLNQSSYTESSIHSFPFLQHFQRTLFVMHLQPSRYKVTVVIPTGVSHHIYTPKMLSSLLFKPIATKHGSSKSFLKYYPVQHNLLTFQQTRVKKKRLDWTLTTEGVQLQGTTEVCWGYPRLRLITY